jgi:peptide/nickel transport system substrate-binding protein
MALLEPAKPARARLRFFARFSVLVAAVAVLALTAALVSSGASKKTAAATAGGTFVMTNLADPDPIDPALVSHTMSRTFVRNVYETLLYYKLGTTSLVPVLATSWKVSSNGLVYTFTLRQGVKFQNGAPFTSADVAATFARDLVLKSGVGGSYLTGVKRVKALGPYSVQITLKKPYVFFPGLLPKIPIASAKDIKANKGSDYAQAWFKDHSNGTGPWMMQSYVRGQQYTLVRNPNYWRKFAANAFDKIVVRPIGDSATQAQLIGKGESDLGSWMSFRDMISASKTGQAKLFDFHSPMDLILSICGGCKPLDNPDVRQALIAAFPYSEMQQFYQGYAQPPRNVLSPTYPGAQKFPVLKQDLNKAKQLLAKAGYADGKGLRPLRYVAVQGLEDERQAGLLLQSALSSIGVEMKIDVLPFSTFLAQAQNAATAPDFAPGYEAPETNDPFQWFSKLFACGGFLNLAHFCSKQLDATIAQAGVTTSATKRITLLHQAQKLIADNGFVITAANFDALYVGASWLGGLQNDLTDLLYDPKFFGMYRK